MSVLLQGEVSGKYSVVSEDLERIGVGALKKATKRPDGLVLVDEIEPMEMTSRPFRDALAKLLSHQGIVIANVKYGSHYSEMEGASGTAEGVRLEVSKGNRDEVHANDNFHLDKWTDRS